MAQRGSNDPTTNRETLEQRVAALEIRARSVAAERDQLARELAAARDAQRAAENAVRAGEELLAVVAHDLRNPLGTIAMAASALAQLGDAAVPDGSRICSVVERIQRQTTRMTQQISNLTDFAEIRGGRLVLDRAPHAPSAIIAAARALIEPGARERGFSFEAGTAPDLPAVTCDADRVARALASLFAEAIQLVPGRGRIEIGARESNGRVEFFVRDHRHADEAVRDASQRSRAAANFAATVARGIIEAHGGQLWADDTPSCAITLFSLAPAG